MPSYEYPLDQSRRHFWMASVGKAFCLALVADLVAFVIFTACIPLGDAQGGLALLYFAPLGVGFFLALWLWLVLLFYVLDFRGRRRAFGSDATDHERENVGAAMILLVVVVLAVTGAGFYFLRW